MDWLWPLLAAPFVGSFLGVLIRRLPLGKPVALARSHCEACATPLAPRDLVPVVSFLALGGRCRWCGAKIAARHWQVELAALAVAACAVWIDSESIPVLWVNCAFGWSLLALAWIDCESWVLPDMLTLPLIPAGLVATLWLSPDDTTEHAVAAALGYGAFQALSRLYRRVRGREGLGGGDAKLLAALGAWTGLEGLPNVILIAALAGLGLALLLSARGRKMTAATPIPFGPCLALAGWIVRLHPWGA